MFIWDNGSMKPPVPTARDSASLTPDNFVVMQPEVQNMTRQELIDYIFDEYSVEPDYPFLRDDVSCVFRHIDNRKWFGIAMVIPYRTIGINKAGNVDILNVKCDPIMIGSLRKKPGFRPAYHMSKNRWITILLDESADREEIKTLQAMSYTMTGTKTRAKL